MLNGDAETTLLDVPDALIALERWPGQIKVLGPVSEEQHMATAFRPDSPDLRSAFNDYRRNIVASGEYQAMVRRYYPAVFDYVESLFVDGG